MHISLTVWHTHCIHRNKFLLSAIISVVVRLCAVHKFEPLTFHGCLLHCLYHVYLIYCTQSHNHRVIVEHTILLAYFPMATHLCLLPMLHFCLPLTFFSLLTSLTLCEIMSAVSKQMLLGLFIIH